MYRDLKAPFPYFGGKRTVASEVWRRFGTVKMYVEPFFGSGAVLLARPRGDYGVEIANDYDGNICNVWRAIKYNPNEVAYHCDFPANHIELMARRWQLQDAQKELRRKLIDDTKFYDAELAGYWVWCAANWIGGGMLEVGDKYDCARPQLTHRNGIMQEDNIDGISRWLTELSVRLRQVRVVCGDWSRAMGGKWRTSDQALGKNGKCGVFLDPPYGEAAGRSELYNEDSFTVADDVRDWCIKNGDNDRYRIALCGYDGEHNELEGLGWDVFEWAAAGGYGNQSKKRRDIENRTKERIWFSPYCLKDLLLFD